MIFLCQTNAIRQGGNDSLSRRENSLIFRPFSMSSPCRFSTSAQLNYKFQSFMAGRKIFGIYVFVKRVFRIFFLFLHSVSVCLCCKVTRPVNIKFRCLLTFDSVLLLNRQIDHAHRLSFNTHAPKLINF